VKDALTILSGGDIPVSSR